MTDLPRFGVVFDLDGLLVDSERVQAMSFNEVLAPYGVVLDEATFARLVGIATERNFHDLKEWFPRIAATVVELLDRKSRAYARLIPLEMRPMPGAVALVRALVAASVPLAVASSSPHDDIGPSLVAVGLDALLPVRVSGFDVARMKPAPDVYLRAIDLLGLSPSACVAVEDAQAGVEAAKAAGLSCVAVPNRYTLGRHDFRAADAVVASLETVTAELLETLALRRK